MPLSISLSAYAGRRFRDDYGAIILLHPTTSVTYACPRNLSASVASVVRLPYAN